MTATVAPAKTAAALPFPIGSRVGIRPSFSTGAVVLSATTPTPVNPISIPAVGYLRYITLEVTLTGTAGTAPAFTADGPFNVLQSVEFRTSAGNDIIVPITGYQLMGINKYGGYTYGIAPYTDPRAGRQYSAVGGVAPTAHFFLNVPVEFDSETALGSIPALASNRSYQLILNLAAIPTVLSGAPGVTVTVNGTAHYWNEPPSASQSGLPQVTKPAGLGTICQWQYEAPPLSAGDKLIKLNNVGNVLRNVIFTLRNSSGVRIDAAGWPAICELYLDNEPMFNLSQNEWEQRMTWQYGLVAATKDVVNGLDTGVYVIPFHMLAGSISGDPANTRAQYLPTLDSSQLQLRGSSWGANAATLEILTNSVIPSAAGISDIYNK